MGSCTYYTIQFCEKAFYLNILIFVWHNINWIQTWILRVRHSSGLIVLEKHQSHVITWHHPSLCLSSWDDQHTPLVIRQELCAGQHHKASEPQIVALWRWITNSPSRDSTLLAVNHTGRNEVKWHYLHYMGASSIFINGVDSLYSLERGSTILGNGYK